MDQGDGLLDPPLLKSQRDADIVMACLDDDERGRERPEVKPRDLGGDRSLAADPGSHVARTRIPVYDGIPVQPPSQDGGPRLAGITWPDPCGERGADDREGGHAGPALATLALSALELLLAAGQRLVGHGLAGLP